MTPTPPPGTLTTLRERARCTETVTHGGGFNRTRCSRAAAVTRDGKGYCKQHDPDVVKAKRAASDARFQAERDRAEAMDARAKELARRLGVHTSGANRVRFEPLESFSISFADAEKLIARLGGEDER